MRAEEHYGGIWQRKEKEMPASPGQKTREGGHRIFRGESMNLTSMFRNWTQLFKSKADVVGFQKHGMTNDALQNFQDHAEQAGWIMEVGSTGAEYDHPVGGVGVIARKPLKPMLHVQI